MAHIHGTEGTSVGALLSRIEDAVRRLDPSGALPLFESLQAQISDPSTRDVADSLSLEIEDKLWGAGLAALDPRAAPDVLVMALRVAEILSRSRCRTCSSLPPKDGGLRLDAVTRVARALEAHPECGPVAVSAARSLQAMAGCATCRCFHDRASQDILGQGGAIEALVNTLMHACCAPQDNAPPPEHMWEAREACLQALHLICLNHDKNVELLSAAGAWGVIGAFIEAALDGDTACAALVPHASVLLCELAGREEASDEEILFAVDLLVETMETWSTPSDHLAASVWSLNRLLSLTVCSLLYDYEPSPMASCWATAETRGLSIALAALARIAETWDKEEEAGGPTGQADPADGPLPLGGVTSETLAKHLLDFLAAVGPHCSYAVADVEREEAGPLREGACPASQRTTSDAAAAAAWAFASRSRPRAPWLDTVGMRAYYFVLQGPCFSACSCMAAGELVRIGKKLCEVLGNAAQCSRGYIGPEIFSLHVYGLGALCLLLHKSVMAPECPERAKRLPPASSLTEIWQALHQASDLMCKYMAGGTRGRDDFDYEFSVGRKEGEDGRLDEFSAGCCKYSVHCSHLHEPVRATEILRAFEAVTTCLMHEAVPVPADDKEGCAKCKSRALKDAAEWNMRRDLLLEGAPGGDVNGAFGEDGLTLLHRVASSGLSEVTAMVMAMAGRHLDLLKRAKSGATALQLSRDLAHVRCAEMLQGPTEAAAAEAQEKLLRELEGGGGEGGQGKEKGGKSKGGKAKKAKKGKKSGGAVAEARKEEGGEGAAAEARQREEEERERRRREEEAEYEKALAKRRAEIEEERREREKEEERRRAEERRREEERRKVEEQKRREEAAKAAEQRKAEAATSSHPAKPQPQANTGNPWGTRPAVAVPAQPRQQASGAPPAGKGMGSPTRPGVATVAVVSRSASKHGSPNAKAATSHAPRPAPSAAPRAPALTSQSPPAPPPARAPQQQPQQQQQPAKVAPREPGAGTERTPGSETLGTGVYNPFSGLLPGVVDPIELSEWDGSARQSGQGAGATAAQGLRGSATSGDTVDIDDIMRYLALDGPDSSAGVDSAFPMPWEQPSPAQAKEAPAWMPPSTVAPPDRAPRADGQNTGTPSWAPWGTFGEAPAVAADLSDLALGMVTSFLQESEGPGSGGETRERGVAGAWERPWGDREAGGQEDKEVVGPHGRPDSRIGAPVGGSGAGGAAGQGAGGWGTSMSLFSMPVDTMEIEEGEGEGSCADEVGEEEGMSDVGDDDGSGVGGGAGRFLWLGNLKHGLKKSTLLSIFRPFGRIQDVVMFPGKQFAFVNFVRTDDAVAAAQDLGDKIIPEVTGERELIVRMRQGKHRLGRSAGLDVGAGRRDGDLGSPPGRSDDSAFGNTFPPRRENGRSRDSAGVAGGDLDRSFDREGGRGADGGRPFAWGAPHKRDPEGTYGRGTSAAFRGRVAADSMGDITGHPSEGSPNRHLWLGNLVLKPEARDIHDVFAPFGTLETIRIFPGKSYAFVNFASGGDAIKARRALDGKVVSSITGGRPLLVRYQASTPADTDTIKQMAQSRSTASRVLVGQR